MLSIVKLFNRFKFPRIDFNLFVYNYFLLYITLLGSSLPMNDNLDFFQRARNSNWRLIFKIIEKIE